MADLMTETYTYKDLVNQYGNFHLPAVKIYVNGTELLSSMGLLLEEIEVVLSLDSASSVQFKLGNVYDVQSRSFRSGLKDKFKPGTIVEVALGYYSSTIKIFKGFVYMLGCEFGEKAMLAVTAMDVRKLMMISGSRHVLHNVKNYSDAFKTIMADYGALCSVQVTATDDKLEIPVSQVSSDYDFVMEELVATGKSSREFFVVADKAYFRERPGSQAPLMQLEYGRELLSLEMDYAYLDLEIQVVGFNAGEQTAYTGTARAKSKEPQSSLISPAPVRMVTDPDADNQDKVSRRAGSLADMETERVKRGKLTTVGLPEIVPGRFIEVVKTEAMVNRKYYISEVRHHVGEGIFTTEIDIGGWC